MIKFIHLPEFGMVRFTSKDESRDYKFTPETTPRLELGLPYSYLSSLPDVKLGDEYYVKCVDSGFRIHSIYKNVVRKESDDYREVGFEERGKVEIGGHELFFRRRMSRVEKEEEVVEDGVPASKMVGGFESIMRIGKARELVECDYESENGLYRFYTRVRGMEANGPAKDATYWHMFPSRRWVPELNLSEYDVEFCGFVRELSHPSSKIRTKEWWIFQMGENAEKLRALQVVSNFERDYGEVETVYRSMKDRLAETMAQLV